MGSKGVQLTQSQCTISGNTIHGGTSAGTSIGIEYSNGGDSGIYTGIGNNTIFGGSGGTTAIGVKADGAPGNSPILLNTIDGAVGPNATSLKVSGGSTPAIANNILFVSGVEEARCVDETGNGCPVVLLLNNDLWDRDGTTVLCRDHLSIEHDTDLLINALSGSYGGNVSLDPSFVDADGPDGDIATAEDNDWQLSAGSPANVKQGGLDVSLNSPGWEIDRNGVTRTNLTQGPNDSPTNGGQGWSMGAYERD